MIDLELSEAELDAQRGHIESYIRETAADAGTDSAVLGLSGGIDSTLTAYLAVEALGTENVHGLVMPGAVSREENMSDAEWVASELEIPYDVFEINPIVDTFLSAYSEADGDRMAVGNARARTRAVMNYLVANHEGSVVLGTGNRTEALVGYFTKYGDGAVDCHPIGNLYKQQVRQLAGHVGVPENSRKRKRRRDCGRARPTRRSWVSTTTRWIRFWPCTSMGHCPRRRRCDRSTARRPKTCNESARCIDGANTNAPYRSRQHRCNPRTDPADSTPVLPRCCGRSPRRVRRTLRLRVPTERLSRSRHGPVL